MSPILVGFVLYLALVLAVGIWAARQTQSHHDYALGGRKLGPWVLSLSERASSESAWLVIGLPGMAFVGGLFGIWIVLGIFMGSIVSWRFIAPMVCRLSHEYDAITLPELLCKRYDSEAIRLLSAVIITFFFVFYVSAQFAGAGKVLNVTFGIDPMIGMIIGAGIITFYTLIGGFLAVAWTDVAQAGIMFCTLVILPMVAMIELGQMNSNFQIFDSGTLFGGKAGVEALVGVISGLSWGLGYFGNPHIIARYMAAKSEADIKKGLNVVILYSIPAFLGSLCIGLTGKGILLSGALLDNGIALTELADKERIMPLLATSLLNPWVAGIFISGAIAAMMSTADSQLLVTTTSLTKDFFAKFRPSLSGDSAQLKLNRILTIAVGLIAFVMAWAKNDLVFNLVSYAWGGLGASFGPILLLTLWWTKTSKAGVIAGLVSGTVFTIFDATGGAITARVSAFVLATVFTIVISLVIPNHPKNGTAHVN